MSDGNSNSDSNAVTLSQTALDEIEREAKKYPPQHRASTLPAALRIAQDEHGWLSEALIEYIAKIIGVPPVRAFEVASFYTMYDLAPVGKHKISVCTNISCMLRGSDQIVDHLKTKLNINFNETTSDGKFTLKEAECLAACAGAPMMQVDRDYYEDLTPEKIDEILDGLKNV